MCKAPWPRPICSYAAHPVSLLYTCQTNVARYPCSRLLMKASAAERLFPHAICTSSIMRTQKRFSSSRPSASSREGKLSQCKHSTLVIDAIKSRERPCRGPRHGQGCGRWRPERHTAATEAGQVLPLSTTINAEPPAGSYTAASGDLAVYGMLTGSWGGLPVTVSRSRAPTPAPPPVFARPPALRQPAR